MTVDKFITAAEAFEITMASRVDLTMSSVEDAIVQAAEAGRCVTRIPVNCHAEHLEEVYRKIEASGFKVLDTSIIGGITITVAWGEDTLTGLVALG